jgi:hypothetical protein
VLVLVSGEADPAARGVTTIPRSLDSGAALPSTARALMPGLTIRRLGIPDSG